MLYRLLRIPARIALLIYCRHLKINKQEVLQSEGPLLIAANHPNSFLDAVILATLFKQPVYSLARSDVFKNNFFAKFFLSLNILPVYRISEGAENLHNNYNTFDACEKIFRQNGIVLIFSEGSCSNEWHLRQLKKGTARLVIRCWQKNIPLKILPVGINYSSFHSFGKNIKLNFGELIAENDIDKNNSFGKNINFFNDKLLSNLKPTVIEINSTDKEGIKKEFIVSVSPIKRIALFIPAVLGVLLNVPLYYIIKKIAEGKTIHKDHFDSIIIALLFISYPFYLLLLSFLTYKLIGGFWWLTIFIIPFFAWSYVQLKN